MSNVSDTLREMANNGTSQKDLIRMMGAAMADIVETTDSIEKAQINQEKYNIKVSNRVEQNENILKNYGRGLWFLGTTGFGYLIIQILQLI